MARSPKWPTGAAGIYGPGSSRSQQRETRRREELDRIIAKENLMPTETYAFVDHTFRDGNLQLSGTAVTKILPPVSRFAPEGGHGEKKRTVLEKLSRFFERFQGLGGIEARIALGSENTGAHAEVCRRSGH